MIQAVRQVVHDGARPGEAYESFLELSRTAELAQV